MIVIRVELHSAITRQVTELARMHICNVGGGEELRDYEVRTLRGRSRESLDRRTVHRRGKVEKHPAKRLHIWHLVGKALVAIGYVPSAALGAGDTRQRLL